MVHLLNEVDIYAAPPAGGSELKFGCGQHRRPGDPDDLDPLAPGEAAEVASAFAPLLRDFADYKVLRGQVCPYAVSPDERFVTESTGPVLVIRMEERRGGTGCVQTWRSRRTPQPSKKKNR